MYMYITGHTKTENIIHVHVQMYMLIIFQAVAIPLAQFYSHNKTLIYM